jgi:hypothetical protein
MDLQVFIENAAVFVPIIIAVTLFITNILDPGKKLERFYPLIPFVLGTVVSLALANPFHWQPIVIGIFMYGFGAMGTYKIGKTTVLGA